MCPTMASITSPVAPSSGDTRGREAPADGRERAAVTGRGHLRPAATLAAAVLLAWTTPAPPAAAQPLAPETGDARAGTWTPELAAYGRASPSRDATLAMPFAGRVATVDVEPGQPVREAQVLARLDAPALTAAVAKLQAADRGAGLAEQRLAGLRQREKASLATRDDELQGEAAASEARAALDEAWRGLEEALVALGQRPDRAGLAGRLADPPDVLARALAEVRAPFAGVVAAVPASAGAILAAGSPLARVEDLDRAVVEVAVAADALDGSRQGAASVETPAGRIPLRPIDGAPRLDPGTGLRLLRYAADDAAGRLGDGEWVRVTARLPARAATWVPDAAVVARGGRTYCLVREGDATRPVAVTVGPAEGGRTPSSTASPPGSGWSRPAPTSCSTATSTG